MKILPECAEGTLEWIPITRVDELDLVEDLPHVLPRILKMDDTEPPLNVHVSYDSSDQIVLRIRDDA